METHAETIRVELQAELDQIAEQMADEHRTQAESSRLEHEAVKNQLNLELEDARMQLTSAIRELDALHQDQAASGGQLTDIESQFRKTRDELILAQDEIERLQAEMGSAQAEVGSLREATGRGEAEAACEPP